jgi:hypothetical protein
MKGICSAIKASAGFGIGRGVTRGGPVPRLASASKGRAYETALPEAAIDAENTFMIKFGVTKFPINYADIVDAGMSKLW